MFIFIYMDYISLVLDDIMNLGSSRTYTYIHYGYYHQAKAEWNNPVNESKCVLCCWFPLSLLNCTVLSIVRCPLVLFLRLSLLLFFCAAVLLFLAAALPSALLFSALLFAALRCSSPQALGAASNHLSVIYMNI